MEKLYQLINACLAFKNAKAQTIAEMENFTKKGLLKTFGDCPSFGSYQAAENEMFRLIHTMDVTDFNVDGSDKLLLQMALVQSEMQLKDCLVFIEEKCLSEDFNNWLHEHDLEKSS